MLPLHTRATFSGLPRKRICKVLDLPEALTGAFRPESVILDLRQNADALDLGKVSRIGFSGVLLPTAPYHVETFSISALTRNDVVAPGDVIRVGTRGDLSVLYRRSANANALFVTERCNSLCLMCSQPPRPENDEWRVVEILQTIALIDPQLPHLGITGGEPTLLGSKLAEIITASAEHLPRTHLHVLTNGRRFADPDIVEMMAVGRSRTRWAIPVYADTSAEHDYVVQAQGAFEETLNGIYNLAERNHSIEIRIVLHALTVPRLLQLAEFIWRTMPFVDHVALMGLEPMGFARINRELLWVDPLDYAEILVSAAWYLHDRAIPVSIYNVPLCVLPKEVWGLAKRSISDWKNTLVDECAPCTMNERCCGFFASANQEWRSRGISAIRAEGTP